MGIVKDKIIDPYQIRIEDNCFTVFEPTGKQDKLGNDLNNIKGYYSTLDSALRRIVQEKIANSQDVYTLEELITTYKQLYEQFKKDVSL